MKTSTSLAVLGISLFNWASPVQAHVSERDAYHRQSNIRQAAPQVVQLQTQRKQPSLPPHIRDHQLRKRRASTLHVSLDNQKTLYFINVFLGSPPQALQLDIDTGSSDLWTNAATSSLCLQSGNLCAQSGTFDANSSSSYTYVNADFYIKYADGSYAIGDYAQDTLSIGGTNVKGLQFGVGYNSTSPHGILGVGYEANEVQVSFTGKEYHNLPTLLKQRSVIKSAAYSLWLNDLQSSTGEILFGGVDTAKYSGPLSTLPIIKEQGEFREFILALTGLTAAGTSIFSNQAVPVLLDSGSSLTYLPDDYVLAIYSRLGASYQADQGAAIVDCSLADDASTVDFTFSSPTIKVSLNELVLVAQYLNGQPVCILGISPAGSSTPVLGDTFLRSAYVVYDLENNQISLAKTNFNAMSSNIKEIVSGAGGVPDATPVPNAVSTATVSTGGARLGGGLLGGASGGAIVGRDTIAMMAVAVMGSVLGVSLVGLW